MCKGLGVRESPSSAECTPGAWSDLERMAGHLILTVPSPAFSLVPLTHCLTQWFLTGFKNDMDGRVYGFLMDRRQGCC